MRKGLVPEGCPHPPSKLDAFYGSKRDGQTIGVSLMELQATHPSCFAVEFDCYHASKAGVAFESVAAGMRYISALPPHKRCFYEFLAEDAPKRLYFDVDLQMHNCEKLHDPMSGGYTDVPPKHKFTTYLGHVKGRPPQQTLQTDFSYHTQISAAQVLQLYDAIERHELRSAFRFVQEFVQQTYGQRIEPHDVICMRAKRQTDRAPGALPLAEKFSYHLVVKHLVMTDVASFRRALSSFHRKEAANFDAEAVDCAPYHRNGVFRMLGCCKNGKENHLVFDRRMNENAELDFCQDIPPEDTLVAHFRGPTTAIPELAPAGTTCRDVLRRAPAAFRGEEPAIHREYRREIQAVLAAGFFEQFTLGDMTDPGGQTFYVQLQNKCSPRTCLFLHHTEQGHKSNNAFLACSRRNPVEIDVYFGCHSGRCDGKRALVGTMRVAGKSSVVVYTAATRADLRVSCAPIAFPVGDRLTLRQRDYYGLRGKCMMHLAEPMGSGKTEQLVRYLAKQADKRWLVVANLRILTGQIHERLQRVTECSYYRGQDGRVGTVLDHPHLVVCFASIWREVGQYDIIVVDETTALLEQLGSMERSERCFDRLMDLLRRADQTLMLDAHFTPIHQQFMQELGGRAIRRTLSNAPQRSRYKIVHNVPKQSYLAYLTHLLDAGETLLVPCTSRKTALEIHRTLAGRRASVIVRETPEDERAQLLEALRKRRGNKRTRMDALVFSPAITTGVDIQLPFHRVVAVFEAASVSGYTAAQMLHRGRNVLNSEVTIFFQGPLHHTPKACEKERASADFRGSSKKELKLLAEHEAVAHLNDRTPIPHLYGWDSKKARMLLFEPRATALHPLRYYRSAVLASSTHIHASRGEVDDAEHSDTSPLLDLVAMNLQQSQNLHMIFLPQLMDTAPCTHVSAHSFLQGFKQVTQPPAADCEFEDAPVLEEHQMKQVLLKMKYASLTSAMAASVLKTKVQLCFGGTELATKGNFGILSSDLFWYMYQVYWQYPALSLKEKARELIARRPPGLNAPPGNPLDQAIIALQLLCVLHIDGPPHPPGTDEQCALCKEFNSRTIVPKIQFHWPKLIRTSKPDLSQVFNQMATPFHVQLPALTMRRGFPDPEKICEEARGRLRRLQPP